MSSLVERVAALPVEIETVTLQPLQLDTGGGWVRRSTAVWLGGGGCEGAGEDVTYDGDDQLALQAAATSLRKLAGRYTLAELSERLDAPDTYPQPAGEPSQRLYRRWAFESAALELALAQAGRTLAALAGRAARPVRYVVSLGLGDPPSIAPLTRVLELYPGARFKVDLSAAWTRELIEQLAALQRIDVVDLKGLYRGAFRGPPANAEQYRWIAELLPQCWLEDPELDEHTLAALEPHLARVTWDANLHSLADLAALRFEPRCVNVKPSRFGFAAELLRFYAYCEARGISMYGGGQFELGPGRRQIQALAALFHPDAPNDVAPSAFNDRTLRAGLPGSPLPPPPFGG